MSEEAYGFTESGARKLAADHKRLEQLPYGGQGAPYAPQTEENNWVFLTDPKTYAESGDTGSDKFVSTSPSGVSLGSYTSVGSAGLYFNSVYGDPRNAGITLQPALTSYLGPLFTFNRTGLYELTLAVHVGILYIYHATYTRVITSSVGSAAPYDTHTHSVTVPYGDPARVGFDFQFLKRAGSTGSFSSVAHPLWTIHQFPYTADTTYASGDVRQRTILYRATAGSQAAFVCTGRTLAGLSGFIGTVTDASLYIRFLGPGPTTARTLASFQSGG